MPRYTAAYSKFVNRMPEIISLWQLGKKYSRVASKSGNANIVRALCRSAVVLLSSHIEGYVEDLGELCIERIVDKKMKKNNLSDSFFYYFSKDLIEGIKETGNPGAISKKIKAIMTRDVDIWADNIIFLSPLPA
jgi:hypothetical protein